MSNSLVTTKSALDKLTSSLNKSSLSELVKAKTRRSLLLVDCSGSMGTYIEKGGRRIDAMRNVVTTLRETHKTPIAAFGLRGGSGPVDVVDIIPEPQGSTPIDLAIEFGKMQGANHLVIVSDGEPNSESAAFGAARTFGGQIDTFYVGDPGGRAPQFLAELAAMTGGSFNASDLGQPKVLAGKIVLMLGDGSDAI